MSAFGALQKAMSTIRGEVEPQILRCPTGQSMSKIGVGSITEERRMFRRTQIREWSRADVRRQLSDAPSLQHLTALIPSSSEGVPTLKRVPLPDALYAQNVDGNALLDLTQDELMKHVGILDLGTAKALMRTIELLCEPPLAEFPANKKALRPHSAGSAVAAVRYSTLDPFRGWEEQLDEPRHPKRHTLFTVKSSSTTCSDVATAKAIENAKDEINRLIASEVSLADDSLDPNQNLIKTKTCDGDNTSHPSVAEVGTDEPNWELETVVKDPKGESFKLGPLEKERRMSEIRSIFEILKSVLSESDLTLQWVTTAVGDCFRWDQRTIDEMILAAYQSLRLQRENAANAVRTQTRRPWSANPSSKPQKEWSVAALQSSRLPSDPSDSFAKSLRLSKQDFRSAVCFFTDKLPPHEFDQLFRFIGSQFGKERQENMRRYRSLQVVFKCLASARPSKGADQVSISQLDFDELIKMVDQRTPSVESHISTSRRKSNRPTSAPTNKPLPTHSIPETVSEESFCQHFLTSFLDSDNMKPEEFDKEALQIRIVAEKLAFQWRESTKASRRKIMPQEELDETVTVQSSSFKCVVLIFAESFDPSGMIQRYFADSKTKQKQEQASDRARNRADGRPAVVAPSPRQGELILLSVESESSIASILETVSNFGIERGFWIFVDCPGNTVDPHTRQGGTGLLSLFLRQLGCKILTKASASIHASFRVFVRCPLDIPDAQNIPQLIRTVSISLEMFK